MTKEQLKAAEAGIDLASGASQESKQLSEESVQRHRDSTSLNGNSFALPSGSCEIQMTPKSYETTDGGAEVSVTVAEVESVNGAGSQQVCVCVCVCVCVYSCTILSRHSIHACFVNVRAH